MQIFDPIGGYFYEHTYCVRDAFAQFFGADHPYLSQLTQSMMLKDVVTWCALHCIRCYHGNYEVTIYDDQPVVWFFAGREEGKPGHAVFCTSPPRIIASGLDVIAVAILPPLFDPPA